MSFIDLNKYYSDDDSLIEEMFTAYNNYFDSVIKNQLSKTFIHQYFKCNGFHDWDVIGFENNTYMYRNPKRNIKVTLLNKTENIIKELHYNGVKTLKIDFSEKHFQQWSYDEYVIDEFHKESDSYLSHKVYFPSGSYYYVEFKSIKII